MNHQTCAEILARLERNGIVELCDVGNCSSAKLNEANAIVADLVLPLLRGEQAMIEDIRAGIHRDFGFVCHLIKLTNLMTGRGRVDLVAPLEHHESLREMADQRIAGIEERYGIALEIRIFSWANAPPDVAFG